MTIKIFIFDARSLRKDMLVSFTILLSAFLLIFSVVSIFSGFSPFVAADSAVVVNDETELVATINAAEPGVPNIIALGGDIDLTQTLVIPTNKEITLISETGADFYKLTATHTKVTITVFGTLTLDGIIVTHANNLAGGGVNVASNGICIMVKGEISNNRDTEHGGGGVCVNLDGDFTMLNGMITNNTSTIGGGGVNVNPGSSFTMYGGMISGNTADFGGGVCIENGIFTMFDGMITNNAATSQFFGGGGVLNGGTFIMHNGEISNNVAAAYILGGGGGVSIRGGYLFIMEDGKISGNTASVGDGGGVFLSANGNFTMRSGEISNNIASNGGGVYVSGGSAELSGGVVLGNVASGNGGGVWVTNTNTNLNRLYVALGVVFSDNRASAAYNRHPDDDSIYAAQIAGRDWSKPFTQGYNNYDISYTNGTPLAQYTVGYDPGTQGTWQAVDETYPNFVFGEDTPVFGTRSGADHAVDHTGGYRFTGWQPTWSPTVSGSITYVAQWATSVEPIFYTVTYNGNGYTGGMVPLGGSYPAGYSVLIASQGSMVREGFDFQGWAYNSDAKTPDFVAGSTSYLGLTGDVTLFAVWFEAGLPLSYTVSYLPGEYGTFGAVSFVCGLGDLTPKAPVVTGQSGWSFIGWAPNPTPTVLGDATYVAQWEPETTPTPSTSPTTTPTPSPSPAPTRPPTSTPTPTPTRPPTSTPTPTPTPLPTLLPTPSPTTSPPGENVDEKPVWALVNLVLSVVGVILAILLAMGVLLQRSQKHTKSQTKQTEAKNAKYADKQDVEEDEVKKQKQRRLLWFTLSVILGITGVVVFLFTEDLSRPIGLVDSWTAVNAIILAVQIIATAFTFKQGTQQEKDTSDKHKTE